MVMDSRTTDPSLLYEMDLVVEVIYQGFVEAKGKYWFPLKSAISWASDYCDIASCVNILWLPKPGHAPMRPEDNKFVLRKISSDLQEKHNLYKAERMRLAMENCTPFFSNEYVFRNFLIERSKIEHLSKKAFDISSRWMPGGI